MDNVFSCIVLTSHFCGLDTGLHPADRYKTRNFLFKHNKKKIKKYCWFFILDEALDQALSIDKNPLAITMPSPRKLYITCCTYLHPYNLRHPFDSIYLLSSCEEILDLFFLSSNDKITREVDSRKLSIKFINFEKRYKN